MSRALLGAVVLLALGAAVWLALEGAPSAREPAPESAPAPPPLFLEIRGRVVDAHGEPAPGVPVGLTHWPEYRLRAPTYGRRWAEEPGEALRRALDRHAGPPREKRPPGAHAVSDATGVFVFEELAPGAYAVEALPERPLGGSMVRVDLDPAAPAHPPVLRVREVASVRGRVVDPAGRGVGAVLEGKTHARWDEFAIGPVPTDAEGRFAFEAVAGRYRTFTLTVPGRLMLRGLQGPADPGEDWTIRLPDPEGPIWGRVLDPDGEGIGGAQVLVALALPEWSGAKAAVLAATAGPDGRFRVEGAPVGEVEAVSALARGFLARVEGKDVDWLSGGTEEGVVIRLARAFAIEGHVTEEESGTALPSVEVMAIHRSSGLARTARSDDRGTYRIGDLEPGRYVLVARGPGHYLPEVEEDGDPQANWDRKSPDGPPPSLAAVVAKGGSVLRRDLRMRRGHEVRGEVALPDGTPAAGAAVFALDAGLARVAAAWGLHHWAEEQPRARTGPDGRFRIANLPPREALALLPHLPGFVGRTSEPIDVGRSGQAPDVILVLDDPATLLVRVVDETGVGVADAHLGLSYEHEPWDPVPTRTGTSSEGTARLEGMPVHTGIQILGPGGWTRVGRLSPREVREVLLRVKGRDLAPTSPRDDPRADPGEGPGGSVAGRLVDVEGAPVGGQALWLARAGRGKARAERTRTREDGRFLFEDVPFGRGRLLLPPEAPGARWTSVGEEVQVPASDLHVAIPRAVRRWIEGLVLDGRGDPVPYCAVRIRSMAGEDPDRGPPMWQQTLGGRLRCVAEGAPPFEVRVLAPRNDREVPLDLRPHLQTLTTLPAGPLVIRLEEGMTLQGRVVDPEGRGVPGAHVLHRFQVCRTGADGRFDLIGLWEHRTEFDVRVPPGWMPLPRATGTTHEELVLRARPAAAITGRVLGPGGLPLRRGGVWARWGSGRPRHDDSKAEIGPAGTFRVVVPQGSRVRLEVNANPRFVALPDVVLEAVDAGTTGLVITVDEGATIQGRIVEGETVRVRGFLSVSPVDEPRAVTGHHVEQDGSFHAQVPRPGRYLLSFQEMHDDAPEVRKVVTAPAEDVVLVLPHRDVDGSLAGAEDPQAFTVVAAPHGGGWSGTPPVRPAEDGRFRIEGLGEGRFDVRATDGGDRYALARLEAGATAIQLHVRTGEPIEGRVETDLGPAEWGSVWAHSDEWSTKAAIGHDGTFRFRGLPPGTYRLQARDVEWRKPGPRREAKTGDTQVLLRR